MNSFMTQKKLESLQGIEEKINQQSNATNCTYWLCNSGNCQKQIAGLACAKRSIASNPTESTLRDTYIRTTNFDIHLAQQPIL
jgi:hypothetical protein